MDENGSPLPLGDEGYDDMRVAGWDDFLAARDRFLGRLRPREDDGGEELSPRRPPA